MIVLRDYQELAIQQIRMHWASGRKRVLLRMPTGAGKTTIFCNLMAAASKNNVDNLMVVRGRKLVDQASKTLFRNEVNHGVLMNNHWNANKLSKTQVCSIDTVISRGEFPPAKLVIIDEAHLATSDGFMQFAAKYPDAYFLSVTATPYTEKPLQHLVDAIVHPISMKDLMKQGYLTEFRYFAPSEPDLSDVKIVNKEYQNEQLAEKMNTLTGDIVGHWRKLGQNRPTLLFAVNIKHSKHLVNNFIANGVPSRHCDAGSTDAEREEAIKQLATGEIKVLSNVGIFCTGVDIPAVSCMIMARPTRSFALFVQQVGRGTRPYHNLKCDDSASRLSAIAQSAKPNCIVLDHAGNIGRHGHPTTEPEVTIEGKIKKGHQAEAKICKACFIAYSGPFCPECGPRGNPDQKRHFEVIDGELKEIFEEIDPIKEYLLELERRRELKGYKKFWVYHELIKKFGEDLSKPYIPENFFRFGRSDPFSGSRFKAKK